MNERRYNNNWVVKMEQAAHERQNQKRTSKKKRIVLWLNKTAWNDKLPPAKHQYMTTENEKERKQRETRKWAHYDDVSMSLIRDSIGCLCFTNRCFCTFLNLRLVQDHARFSRLSSGFLRAGIDRFTTLNLSKSIFCLKTVDRFLHLVDAHDPMFRCIRFFDMLQIEVLVSDFDMTRAVKAEQKVMKCFSQHTQSRAYPGGERWSLWTSPKR